MTSLVFFRSLRRPSSETDLKDYATWAKQLGDKVKTWPGFFQSLSFRHPNREGVTVSVWENAAAFRSWKEDPEHRKGQELGRSRFYETFSIEKRELPEFAGPRPQPILETSRLTVLPSFLAPPAVLLNYYRENRDYLTPTSPAYPEHFYTLDYWERATLAAATRFFEDREYRFVLLSKADRALPCIGTVTLSQVARGPFQAAYLGFGGDYRHEGKGLMREGINAVIDYAFDALGLHRLMANHLVENHRSEKLLARLGFVTEGRAKDYLKIQGRWRDHVLTSKTNSKD